MVDALSLAVLHFVVVGRHGIAVPAPVPLDTIRGRLHTPSVAGGVSLRAATRTLPRR